MENTLDKLKKAAEGLFFMSESDYPFETVGFKSEKPGAPIEESLLKNLGLPAGTSVEKQELTFFLRNQTRDLPEHGPEEKVRAQKFRELEILLKKEIPDIAVYRIGQVQIDAYLIGNLPDGGIGGLKTKQVET